MKSIIVSKKNRNMGRPSDYDPDKHIPMLGRIFKEGGGPIQFCSEAHICLKTFENWKTAHIQFKRAYNLFLPKAAAVSEERAIREGKDINFQTWSFIHKNRFGKLYPKLPKSKDRSVQGKLDSAWSGLKGGSLSAGEFNQVTSGIMSQLKIKELELKNRELELKAKELEIQRTPKLDMKGVPDWAIQVFMAVKEGKEVVIVGEKKT